MKELNMNFSNGIRLATLFVTVFILSSCTTSIDTHQEGEGVTASSSDSDSVPISDLIGTWQGYFYTKGRKQWDIRIEFDRAEDQTLIGHIVSVYGWTPYFNCEDAEVKFDQKDLNVYQVSIRNPPDCYFQGEVNFIDYQIKGTTIHINDDGERDWLGTKTLFLKRLN